MSGRDEWRWADDQGVQRLVRTDELRAAIATSVLPPDVLVWREGMSDWAPALTVPEFATATLHDAKRPEGLEAALAAETAPKRGDLVHLGRVVPLPDLPLAPRPVPGTRPFMKTLVGLSGDEPPTEQTGPTAPIVVPAAQSATEVGARAITQLPRFTPVPSGGAPPAIPRAPRMPSSAPPAAAKKTGIVKPPPVAPVPKVRPDDIDNFWSESLDDSDVIDEGDDRAPTQKMTAAVRPPSPVKPPSEPAKLADRGPEQAARDASKPATARESSRPPAMSIAGGPTAQVAEKPRQSKPPPPLPAKRSSSHPPSLPMPTSTAPAAGSSGPRAESKAPEATKPSKPPPPLPSKRSPAPALAKSSATDAPADARAPGELPPLPAISTPPKRDASKPPEPRREERDASRRDGSQRESIKPRDDARREPAKMDEARREPAKPLESARREPAKIDERSRDAGKRDERREPAKRDERPRDESKRDAAKRDDAPRIEAKRDDAKRDQLGRDEKRAAPGPGAAQPVAPASTLGTDGDAGPITRSGTLKMPAVTGAGVSAASAPPSEPSASLRASAPVTEASPVTRPSGPTSSMPPSSPSLEPRPSRLASLRPSAIPLKEPVLVPVSSLLGAGAALIIMVVGAFLFGRCSVGRQEDAHRGIAAAVGSARAAPAAAVKPCWVTRQPVLWAPSVSKSIPFEVESTPSGALLVGYARGAEGDAVEDEAVGMEINPASGEVHERFAKKIGAAIERVTPLPGDPPTFVTATAPTGSNPVTLNVPAAPPFVLLLGPTGVGAADRADQTPTPVWPLQSEKAPEAARVLVRPEGYAVAFRLGKAILGGVLGTDRKPHGELVHVKGSGGSVGKPMLADNGKSLAIVFADRPNEHASWQIRIGSAQGLALPAATRVVPLPKGGPGGDAFAPALIGLPDGRWLLIWTEGAAGSRAVRAQTFAPDLAPVGDPIALSPPYGNFGQGVLGYAGGYAAAVFLSKGKTDSYELWGAVLSCG